MNELSDSSSSSSLALTAEDPTMSRKYPFLRIIQWICSLTLITFGIYLVGISLSGGLALFTLHPICMSISFLILFPLAISFFDTEQYKSWSHKDRGRYHLVCQAVGIGSATMGFLAVYVNKNLMGKSHFTSYHGLSGLLVMIVVLAVGSGGVLAHYSIRLRSYVRPVLPKIFHAGGGILLLVTGYLTVILGLFSHWYSRNGAESLIYPIFATIIISTFLLLRKSVATLKERIQSTFVRNNL